MADARLALLEVAGPPTGATPDPAARTSAGKPRPRFPRWSAGLAAGVIIALALYGTASLRRDPERVLPLYRPLTFRTCHVSTARFAPDGLTVIFGMSTSDHPLALYSTRTNSIESRRLDLPDADVLGISQTGRMLILLGSHRQGSWVRVGTLAEVDLAGGSPRSLVESAEDGAISPDGTSIAVVRDAGAVRRLEYPLGHALFETVGWISHVAISPDGRSVAYLHHPFYGDDQGLPMVVGPDGEPRGLAPATTNSLQGLAWSPDGASVRYTEYDFDDGAVLWSVRPGDRPKALLRTPLAFRLQDISRDGRMLVISGNSSAEIVGRLEGQTKEQRYEGWNDDSIGAISADGRLIAGDQQQSNTDGEYTAYVRGADGAPPVLLGLGTVNGMTPDGRWVFTQRMNSDRNRLTLYPTGPGSPLRLDLGDVTPVTSVLSQVTCSRDGRRAAFTGRVGGGEPHAYVLELDLAGRNRSEPDSVVSIPADMRPVGPAGTMSATLSPDGERVALLAIDGSVAIQPVDGGDPTPVPGVRNGEVPLQWTRDGRCLLVWNQVFPAEIVSIRVADGKREKVREIMPYDPAGVLYGQILLAPGGDQYVYRFRRDLNILFLARGIR